MTSILERKTRLIFETADSVVEKSAIRPVIVEAGPLCANVRLKGCRTSYAVSYGAIYHLAARMAAERDRSAKKGGRR
jgi:hypothetical protein